jgi:GDP-L-fucose synthase
MKVFIAGHTGMVGRALVRNANSELELITADRNKLDLRDKNSVFDFLREEQPNAVILAAARVGGIAANSANHRDFLLQNLEIQNAVIGSSATLEIPKLVFMGSSCIYPKNAPQPISEDYLLTGPLEETNEGYALAKITGARLCKAISDQQKLMYATLMPTNLYGPNDNFNPESSHVPAALMRRFHEAKERGDREVVVWGSGRPKREFMHVDDLALACWHMLQKEAGGELINVGTGLDLEISQFAQLMAKVVSFNGEIVFDTSKSDGTPRKLLDVSKAHSLGWRHQIELEDGLTKTYAWFVNALKKGEVRGY